MGGPCHVSILVAGGCRYGGCRLYGRGGFDSRGVGQHGVCLRSIRQTQDHAGQRVLLAVQRVGCAGDDGRRGQRRHAGRDGQDAAPARWRQHPRRLRRPLSSVPSRSEGRLRVIRRQRAMGQERFPVPL